MSDTKIVAPVTAYARFVMGDIKGGAAAHAVRIENIQLAIEQAYKGNSSPLKEALALASGQAKKARAYHAGFVACDVEGMERVPYTGALALPVNAAARETIGNSTRHAVSLFNEAFLAVMGEKAKPRTKKEAAEAPSPVVSATPAPADTDTDADDSTSTIDNALLRAAAVATVLDMIRTGMLDSAQLAELDAALTMAADDVEVAYIPTTASTQQPALAH